MDKSRRQPYGTVPVRERHLKNLKKIRGRIRAVMTELSTADEDTPQLIKHRIDDWSARLYAAMRELDTEIRRVS